MAMNETGKCTCVYATARNTPSVRLGYEMGGYVKEECEACYKRRMQSKAMNEDKWFRIQGIPGLFVDKSDFDAERQARLEAERQVGELREQLDKANNLRLAAEHNLLDVREQLAKCCERADTLQVAADASSTMLDTAMGLLISLRHGPGPKWSEVDAFINTTSTEGKDYD